MHALRTKDAHAQAWCLRLSIFVRRYYNPRLRPIDSTIPAATRTVIAAFSRPRCLSPNCHGVCRRRARSKVPATSYGAVAILLHSIAARTALWCCASPKNGFCLPPIVFAAIMR
jgi:hypothetical protein